MRILNTYKFILYPFICKLSHAQFFKFPRATWRLQQSKQKATTKICMEMESRPVVCLNNIALTSLHMTKMYSFVFYLLGCVLFSINVGVLFTLCLIRKPQPCLFRALYCFIFYVYLLCGYFGWPIAISIFYYCSLPPFMQLK